MPPPTKQTASPAATAPVQPLTTIGIRKAEGRPGLFEVVKVEVGSATTDTSVIAQAAPYYAAEQSFIQAASNHVFPILLEG